MATQCRLMGIHSRTGDVQGYGSFTPDAVGCVASPCGAAQLRNAAHRVSGVNEYLYMFRNQLDYLIATSWTRFAARRYAIARNMLSSCVYVSVCLCVCDTPVLYQNG